MPSQLSPAEIEQAAAHLKASKGKTLSPLDYRFLVSELLGYVSHDADHKYNLLTMRAYVDTLRELKQIPDGVARTVMDAYTPGKVPCDEADKVEEMVTKHDVRAKVRVAQSVIPEPMRGWAYLAPTSFDLRSTAMAAALRDAGMEVILPDAIKFERALIGRARAEEEKGPLIMMGRTHLQHAACTTFGHVTGEWLGGIHPYILRFYDSVRDLRGKFSGFVGTRAAQKLLFKGVKPADIAKGVMKRMHLAEDELTGQVVHQAYFEPYFGNLVGIVGGTAKFADDIRKYSQTEVGEIVELRKMSTAAGSSTGAHKANPIDAENVCGHLRAITGDIIGVAADVQTDFQRDLINSSNARYYVPGVPAKADYTIRRATGLVEIFKVRRNRIANNIGLTKGQVIAEPLQLSLQLWTAKQGRFFDAYEHVKKLSEKAAEADRPLQEVAKEDELIAQMLKELPLEDSDTIMDPVKYIGTAHEDAKAYFSKVENDLKLLEEAVNVHIATVVYV
jgi:adenylosuccinate lyase